MKKIVCELCEGTEFTKEGGFFICNGCGTKYSLEEAKSMMKEVEGGAPGVASAPVVGVPAGNPNQQQIDNLLLLATNAFSASNNEETEKYCNRAIEYDAMCYKAWFLKAKAIGWSSKLNNNRIAEAAHSFKQAVDFAPEDEKDALRDEAIEELKRLGLACVSLRQKRFSQYPDNEELAGFVSDIEPLVDGVAVLLSKGAEVASVKAVDSIFGEFGKIPSIAFITMKIKANKAGVPKEFFSQIAVMMGNAGIEGYNTTTQKYNNNNRPMQNDYDKTMDEVDNCISLLDMANDASDDDLDDDIKRYNIMIKMQEYVIGMSAYSDYSSSYRSWCLTDKAKQARRDEISNYRKKIEKVEQKAREKAEEERKKAEEEKQARIEAFWAAHPEEKAALDEEKKQLSEKKNALDAEIAELDSTISAARAEEKAPVPSEAETDKLKDQIRDLERRRSGLGLFSGKEKKQITEEIATLQGRIDSLKGKIDGEKKAKAAEVQQKLAPTQEKRDALDSERTTITKRISAIETELTKDPEE